MPGLGDWLNTMVFGGPTREAWDNPPESGTISGKDLVRKQVGDYLRSPGEDRWDLYLGRSNGYLVLRTTGYHLMMRNNSESSILLNLDHPLSQRSFTEGELRSVCVEMAEKNGIPFIPISETSLHALIRRNGESWSKPTITLVHRQGLEAVFTYKEPDKRAKHFLSAYDTQEDPPLYFLCELPHPARTVDGAREALKPASVKAAEAAGITVMRQGDLFVIESSMGKPALREVGAAFFPHEVVQEDVSLYGTTHTADRIAILPDGRALISGRMTHDPRRFGERRDPDHKPLSLGRKWWWVARNTVPAKTGSPPREHTVARDRSIRSTGNHTIWFETGEMRMIYSAINHQWFVEEFGNPVPVRREVSMTRDEPTPNEHATTLSDEDVVTRARARQERERAGWTEMISQQQRARWRNR